MSTRVKRDGVIPGLLDDLALLCLIRVPRIHHGTMREVCSQWRKLVGSRLFAEERKRRGVAEEVILLLPFECIFDVPIDYMEVDPSSGRVSSSITYSMSAEEMAKWNPFQCLDKGSRFQGIGDRVFFFGFDYGDGEEEAGEEFSSRPCTMLELDAFDRTLKFAPDIPHYIDTVNTDHAVMDGKLWLDFPDDTYDVYDPATGTWTEDVEDVPPGWVYTEGGAFNALELFGYMPSDKVISNLVTVNDEDVREMFFAVTSKGLFKVNIYGSSEGFAVYNLDLSLPQKEQTGKVWTKLCGQDMVGLDMFWDTSYVVLKDSVVLVVPHDEGCLEYRLEEVSSEVKLLHVPEEGKWKVARIVV